MPKVLVLDGEMQSSWAIIESLSKRGITVGAGSESRLAMSFFSRHVRERWIYPSPAASSSRFIEKLLSIVRKGKYDIVLPILDVTTQVVVKHKDLLSQETRVPIVGYETFMKCRDKSQTMRIAQRENIPCPKTYFPDEESIEKLREKMSYPILIKPCVSHGARGIKRVNENGELIPAYETVKREYGACIFQEYIPHSSLQYKAQFFLDKNGDLKAAIVFSKIRYYPVSGGTSTINCTVKRNDIVQNGLRLLRKMNWYGYADIDLIQDPRDGIAKIMEVNPRVTGSVKIALTAGVDFAYMLYKLATDEEVPSYCNYKTGVYLRYLPLDILWFLESPYRFHAQPSFFKFFGRNIHYQTLSLSDPGPAVGYILRHIAALLSSQGRKDRLARGW